MPMRFGVLANSEYPDPKPVGEWLDGLAPRVQPRAPASGPPLTPEQNANIIADRREARGRVAGARVDIANALREQEAGWIPSKQSQMLRDRMRLYYDSGSDDTLRAVDAHLEKGEGYLRDPVAGAGEKYRYRPLTPHELADQQKDIAHGGKGFAGVYSADLPNTVGINYPRYSRDVDDERYETQVHEWLHATGMSQPGPERYREKAIKRAGEPGGTPWAIHKNPENTALFVVRPWPVLGPVPRWPVLGNDPR